MQFDVDKEPPSNTDMLTFLGRINGGKFPIPWIGPFYHNCFKAENAKEF